MKNAALSRALKWLLIAQLLSIAAMLPLAYDLKTLLRAAVGLLTLAALVRAAGAASGYRAALVLQAADLVLSALSYSFGRFFIPWILGVAAARWGGLDSSRTAVLLMTMGVGSFFFSMVRLVLSMLVLLLVCLTTARLVDDPAVAARGIWVWKVNLICIAAIFVLTVVAFAFSWSGLEIEDLSVLSMTITLPSILLTLVSEVLYMVFLYQSARCLSAPD